MVFLRKEIEALPERYPPNYLTFKTADVIGWLVTTSWERIEAYIRTRYTPRQVIWAIEGNEDDENLLWERATTQQVEAKFGLVGSSVVPFHI